MLGRRLYLVVGGTLEVLELDVVAETAVVTLEVDVEDAGSHLR